MNTIICTSCKKVIILIGFFLYVMKDDRNRNEMNEQELKQLTYLQKVNVNLIRKKIGKKSRAKRLIEASEINI